ncbi:MAG: hypothetical protein ACLFS3_01435 [Candidatus Aenigmatarchaeota archaeon]
MTEENFSHRQKKEIVKDYEREERPVSVRPTNHLIDKVINNVRFGDYVSVDGYSELQSNLERSILKAWPRKGVI